MAATNKGKNISIEISSSSDNNGDDFDISSDHSSSFSSENEDSDDDDDVYEIDDDDVDGDDDDDDDDNDDDDDDEEDDDVYDDDVDDVVDDDDDDGVNDADNDNDNDNDNDVAKRVIQFLQGRRDLRELSLKACKAYLRIHGLRVSGNKDECVRRIQEHWRLKDGKAEDLYPSSSFVINCTGDVCKGDIVLFKQKVYGSFDKVTRKGKLLGKRTVAGRVVKESYGAAKQQHTFTVEVLWSKGIKKLPSLFPLLVKGRNLYRLKTYRQAWKNEGERRKVLDEKHRRGTVARNKRAKRRSNMPTNKGQKTQKISHCEKQYQMNFPERGKPVCGEKRASSSTHRTISRHKQLHNIKQGPSRNRSTTKAKPSKHFHKPQNLGSRDGRVSTFPSSSQLYSQAAVGPSHRNMPYDSHSARFQGEMPYLGPKVMSAAQNGISCNRSIGIYYGIQSPWMTQINSRPFFPSRSAPGQWTNGLLNCSSRGCYEPGSNACVISACWRCCRRMGMPCNVHR